MGKRSSTWDSALATFRPLIIIQGEVAYAYNLLQENFFNVFNLVMALERPPDRPVTYYHFALAIWHIVQNDKTQRDLALTALENIPTNLDFKEGIERLKWAQKQADKFANYRNIIIHTPMQLSSRWKDDKIFPPVPRIGGASTKPINVRRLRAIKSVRFWKAVRSDLLNLNDYVDWVTRRIAWLDYERKHGGSIPGARRSWPRKPQLRSIHRIGLIEKIVKDHPVDPRPPPKRRRPSGAPPPARS